MTTPQAPTRHAEVAGAGFAGLTVTLEEYLETKTVVVSL